MEKNEDLEMSNVIKTKKTRQRKRNTSFMSAKSKELSMSKLESDESDDVEGSECKEEEFAARFLLRALEGLRLADDTITVEDLHTFAEKVREDMDLMIGSEKFPREQFDVINQLNFYDWKEQRQTAAHLSEKIIQSQQNLVKNDRDLPF